VHAAVVLVFAYDGFDVAFVAGGVALALPPFPVVLDVVPVTDHERRDHQDQHEAQADLEELKEEEKALESALAWCRLSHLMESSIASADYADERS
jgi:hypothetical protein